MKSIEYSIYRVPYGKVKAEVEMLLVLESSSDDWAPLYTPPSPPSKNIPMGLCQDTWSCRCAVRTWDCSHSWSVKVRQLPPVPSPQPPHAVNPFCVCPHRPGEGRLGRLQLWPVGRITSAVCGPSPSSLPPPVTNRAKVSKPGVVVVLFVMVVLVVNKPEISLKNDNFNFYEKLTIICGYSDRAASHCPKSNSIPEHV